MDKPIMNEKQIEQAYPDMTKTEQGILSTKILVSDNGVGFNTETLTRNGTGLDIVATIVKEKLSEGVMRPLVTAEPAMVEKVLPKIVAEGWTARKVERYVVDNKKKSSASFIKQYNYHKEEQILNILQFELNHIYHMFH